MLNPEIKKIYDLTAHQNRTLLSPDQFVKLFDGKQIVIECIITNDDDDLTVHWQMPPSKANVQYNHEKKLVSVNGINICTWLERSILQDHSWKSSTRDEGYNIYPDFFFDELPFP